MKRVLPRSTQSSRKVERFPPQLSLKPVQSRVLRFTASSDANNVPVDRNSFLKLAFASDAGGLVGNTNYSAVRLRRIKIWSGLLVNAAAGTSMVSCGVEWQSTRGPTSLVSDTGNSFEPAHVDCKPPAESEASFWSQVSSSTTIRNEILFYITCPQGSVVDVHISYVEANGAQIASPAETLVINSITPATSSAYLINSLDNTSNGGAGSNIIRPTQLAYAWGV